MKSIIGDSFSYEDAFRFLVSRNQIHRIDNEISWSVMRYMFDKLEFSIIEQVSDRCQNPIMERIK